VVNITTASKTCLEEKILGSYAAKNLGIVTSQQIKSTNYGPVLFLEQKNNEENTASRAGPTRLRACVQTAQLRRV
jgi:hypothetical protein